MIFYIIGIIIHPTNQANMPVKSGVLINNGKTSHLGENEWAWTTRNQNLVKKCGGVVLTIESHTCGCGFQIMEYNMRLYKMKMRLHKKTCSLASHESKSK